MNSQTGSKCYTLCCAKTQKKTATTCKGEFEWLFLRRPFALLTRVCVCVHSRIYYEYIYKYVYVLCSRARETITRASHRGNLFQSELPLHTRNVVRSRGAYQHLCVCTVPVWTRLCVHRRLRLNSLTRILYGGWRLLTRALKTFRFG